MAGYESKKMLTDRQPQATDDEQDDLTLVYMWAFEKGEESAKVRIEQLTSGPGGIMEMKQTIADKEDEIARLEAALRKIKQSDTCGCQSECIEMCKIAEAALGEKKSDENST